MARSELSEGQNILLSVNPRRRILVLYFLGSLAFIAASIWLIWQDGESRGIAGSSISFERWFGLVFFGLCAVVSVVFFFAKGPSLLATPEGIVLSPPFKRKRFIAWRDVSMFCETTQNSGRWPRLLQSFLSIYLTEEALAARPEGWLSQLGKRMGHGDLTLYGLFIDRSPTKLAVDLMILRERFR